MKQHQQILAKALFAENLSASEIARRTGLSQATVSRSLKDMPVIKLGKGRSSLFAWVDTLEGHPMHAINAKGTVSLLATLYRQPNGRVIITYDSGYTVYDDLPWFLNSVLPSGFLGRLHGEYLSQRLRLNKNPAMWSANEAFLYLLNEADDLAGNLLIGKHSARHYLTNRDQLKPKSHNSYDQIAREITQAEFGGSSVAGEQPKFLTYVQNQYGHYHAIIKYSAPIQLKSPGAQRYRDLLVAEHIALQCLREQSIAASDSRLIEGERLYLEVRRFDRVAAYGRRGIVSLRDVDAEYIGDSVHWYEAADALLRLKLIDETTHWQIHFLYAFGVLIGNTDMHFGNLSFYFEELQLQGLAPIYDMLPMMYMPIRDEVVAREFKSPSLLGVRDDVQSSARKLAQNYWKTISHEPRISTSFRSLAQSLSAN